MKGLFFRYTTLSAFGSFIGVGSIDSRTMIIIVTVINNPIQLRDFLFLFLFGISDKERDNLSYYSNANLTYTV